MGIAKVHYLCVNMCMCPSECVHTCTCTWCSHTQRVADNGPHIPSTVSPQLSQEWANQTDDNYLGIPDITLLSLTSQPIRRVLSRTTPEKSSDTITLGYQTTDGTGMNLDLVARSLKPRCLDAKTRLSHLVYFTANAPTCSFYTVNFLASNSLPYGSSYYSWFVVNSTETNVTGMQCKKKYGNKV